MSFELFARSHGLMIEYLVTDRWIRVPTEDKPSKKNGAYIWDGRSGAVINFAVHDKHIPYKGTYEHDPLASFKRQKAEEDKRIRQSKAKSKAIYIMNQSTDSTHPYLARKGFDRLKAPVWNSLLIVPMRIDQKLVGCQMIDEAGGKKFLSGQITKGASMVIDNKGMDILVEGYATGLSVREVLKQARKRYKIHVCFSAGNMLEIAKGLHDPLVIADNDPIGIKTAQKIGRYWLSDTEGNDFNDDYLLGKGDSLIGLVD